MTSADRPRRPGPTTAQRRHRRDLERSPDTAHVAIRAEVLAYDDDIQRQRLRVAANTEAMTTEIRELWLTNPVGHAGGLRGFTRRWLADNYGQWCDRHRTDAEEGQP